MARYDAITQAAIDYVAGSPSPRLLSALRSAIEQRHPGAIDRARKRQAQAKSDARFVGKVPLWAKRYVDKHWPTLGRLKWLNTPRSSRGRCWRNGTATFGQSSINMYVNPATDEATLRVLVLHEIAHRVGHMHDDRWAAEFHRLLRAEGLYRAALAANFNGTHALRRAAANEHR